MFDVMSGMICFVSATISFLYGTRVCWVCGKDCNFDVEPAEKKQILKARMPAGFLIYCFGLFILFSYLFDGAFFITIMSLTSALILSHFVVSMAMPPLKRSPFTVVDKVRQHP
jgi:hypothetical protein